MRKAPTRKQIQAALTPPLVRAICDLDPPQDATSLCRAVRALVELAFDLAEAGSCPPSVMLAQLQRVVRKRLPRLKSGPAVLIMKAARA